MHVVLPRVDDNVNLWQPTVMSIESTLLDIPFSGGIDEKTEVSQIAPGHLQVASNVLPLKSGSFAKRSGLTRLVSPANYIPGGYGTSLPDGGVLLHGVYTDDSYGTATTKAGHQTIRTLGAETAYGIDCPKQVVSSLDHVQNGGPAVANVNVSADTNDAQQVVDGVVVGSYLWIVSLGGLGGACLTLTQRRLSDGAEVVHTYNDTSPYVGQGACLSAVACECGGKLIVAALATETRLLLLRVVPDATFGTAPSISQVRIVENSPIRFYGYDLCRCSSSHVALAYAYSTNRYLVCYDMTSAISVAWTLTRNRSDAGENPDWLYRQTSVWVMRASLVWGTVWFNGTIDTVGSKLEVTSSFSTSSAPSTTSFTTNILASAPLGWVTRYTVAARRTLGGAYNGWVQLATYNNPGAGSLGVETQVATYDPGPAEQAFSVHPRVVIAGKCKELLYEVACPVVSLDYANENGLAHGGSAFFLDTRCVTTVSPVSGTFYYSRPCIAISGVISSLPGVGVTPSWLANDVATAYPVPPAAGTCTAYKSDGYLPLQAYQVKKAYPVYNVFKVRNRMKETDLLVGGLSDYNDVRYVADCGLRAVTSTGLVDASYHQRPHITGATQATGGSLTTLATYAFICRYVGYLPGGDQVVSAWSNVFNVTMTGSNTKLTLQVNRPTTGDLIPVTRLQLAMVSPSAPGVYTVQGEYPVTSNSASPGSVGSYPILASPSVGSPVVNTALWEGHPAPSCTTVASAAGRLWVNDTSDLGRIWFSQVAETGVGATWYSSNTVHLPQSTTPVTAIAPLDASVLVFTATSIYVISGLGPNLDGTGATYEAQLISTTSGCVQPRSCVTAPDGLYYLATSGKIERVNRALQVESVGEMAQDFLETYSVCVRAFSWPSVPCLMWALRDSSRSVLRANFLGYNYVDQVWFTWTSTLPSGTMMQDAGIDLTQGVGQPWFIGTTDTRDDTNMTGSTQALYRYGVGGSPGLDTGAFFSARIRTGTIRLGALRGFERVRRISPLLRLGTNATGTVVPVVIDVYCDGPRLPSSQQSQTATLNYTDPGFASRGKDVACRLHVKAGAQKCASMVVEMYDTYSGSAGNVAQEGISEWVGLTVEAAVKKGLKTLPSGSKA